MNKSLEAVTEYETYIKDILKGEKDPSYEDIKIQLNKTQEKIKKDYLENINELYKEETPEINPKEPTNTVKFYEDLINESSYMNCIKESFQQHMAFREYLIEITRTTGIKKSFQRSYEEMENYLETANENLLIGMGMRREKLEMY